MSGSLIGVAFDSKGFDTGTISAVGNTWNVNKQGADASGHYTTRQTISGGDANSSGPNFLMFLVGQKMHADDRTFTSICRWGQPANARPGSRPIRPSS